MSKIVNYNKKDIILDYSNKSVSEEEIKKSINIDSRGSGEGKNYTQVEQEAQLYLIRDAMIKKPSCKLKKIVRITQNVDYIDPKEGIVRIVLEGTAIFK